MRKLTTGNVWRTCGRDTAGADLYLGSGSKADSATGGDGKGNGSVNDALIADTARYGTRTGWHQRDGGEAINDSLWRKTA